MEYYVRLAKTEEYDAVDRITYRGYMRTLKELNDSEAYNRASSYVCTAKGSAGMRSSDAMTFVCVERSEKMSLLKSIFHRSVSPPRKNVFESQSTSVQAGLRELKKEYQEEQMMHSSDGSFPEFTGQLKNTDSPGSSDATTVDTSSSHSTRASRFGLPLRHRDRVPPPSELAGMRERSVALVAAGVTPEEMEEYRKIRTLADEKQFKAIKPGVRTRLMRQEGPNEGLCDANELRSSAAGLASPGDGETSPRKGQGRGNNVAFNPTAFTAAVPPVPDDISILHATHRCSVSSTATLDEQDCLTSSGPSAARLADYDPSRGVSVYKKPVTIPLEASVTADGVGQSQPQVGDPAPDTSSVIFTDAGSNDSFFRKFVHRDRMEKPKAERIVGCVTYAPYESGWAVVSQCNEVEIRLLCVTATRGIAGLLIDHCVRIADEEKRSNVHVLVAASNKAAHVLYVRHGFKRNGKLDKFDPKTDQELKCFSFELGHSVPPELLETKVAKVNTAPQQSEETTTKDDIKEAQRNKRRTKAVQHLEGLINKRRPMVVQQLDYKSDFVAVKGA